MTNLLAHEFAMLTDGELLDDLDWMDGYFERCEQEGHGIGSKETFRRNLIIAELTRRGYTV